MRSSSDGYENSRYIHTQGGRFHILEPTWDIGWMAHSLAQTARYRGHADVQYSVAEHCALVAALMADKETGVGGDPFEGLMHDAAECIVGDTPAPFKGLLPDLRAIEKTLDKSVREQWKLPAEKTEACQTADWLALFIEASMILPERGLDFEDPYNLRPRAMQLRERGWEVKGWDWRQAKTEFLGAYVALAPS